VDGTATLDITPVNDAPTTTRVVLSPLVEDSSARLITQADLLANANDVEGDALTATGLTLDPNRNGTLTDNGDGTWSYTPAANDDTGVTFSYTITDGVDTAAGAASFNLLGVNDAPTLTSIEVAPVSTAILGLPRYPLAVTWPQMMYSILPIKTVSPVAITLLMAYSLSQDQHHCWTTRMRCGQSPM